MALAGWLSWLAPCPGHPKVAGSIPDQGRVGGNPSMFLTSMFPPLSQIDESVSLGEDKGQGSEDVHAAGNFPAGTLSGHGLPFPDDQSSSGREGELGLPARA